MTVEQEFRLRYECPTCGTPCEQWIDGRHIDGAPISALCENCGDDCSISVETSPAGQLSAAILGAADLKVQIDHFDYRYDNWLGGLAPVPHPTIVFREAIAEWRVLAESVGDRRSGSAPINRMLLIQLFAALEAYLSDEIINLASDLDDVLAAIVAWDADLSKRTISLTRVAAEPDLVRTMVVGRLRQIQFHRFELIDRLLLDILGERFLPSDDNDRDLMVGSVYVRHHCVHRNGRDLDGRLVDMISLKYLSELEAVFRSCVERIAHRIENFRAAH